MAEAYLVCWWVPAGHVPTVEEAMARLEQLRRDGPSDDVFTLRDAGPAPASAGLIGLGADLCRCWRGSRPGRPMEGSRPDNGRL